MAMTAERESLETKMVSIVGEGAVASDLATRDYYSRDLSYLPYQAAELVVRPGSVEELQQVVAAATEAGHAVVPRGGGMSYTRGYTPERASTVLIDMQGLNRIVEINTEDMYVTVECGCTWKSLVEALREHGVRTPYYGPLSGMYATVGGAIAQNSLFLGSGTQRTVAESVLGLEIVLADGGLLRTGSWAHKNSTPFYRHFGPDVTGLFTADNGAFGFKARATLRLRSLPKKTLMLSFGFERLEEMLDAQVPMARAGIAAECYGFDPYYNATFESKGFSLRQGFSVLSKVAKQGDSRFSGLLKAFRVAKNAQRSLRDIKYSLHMTLEGETDSIASERLRLAYDICSAANGRELSNELPTMFNAAPFEGVSTVILGTDGEIWLPVNAFFPLSRVKEVASAVEQFFEDNRDLMSRHDIRTSYLTCFSGTEFLIEPSFYWYDQVQQFRLDRLEPSDRERWKARGPQEETRAVALELRQKLAELMDGYGGCHLQIARFYSYRDMMNNGRLWQTLEEVKQTLDPKGLVNPGSLGFE